MRLRATYIAIILLSITSLYNCKIPYAPSPTTTTTNYLVVEGLINIADSTYIQLSRTANITSGLTVKPELRAVISIESNTGGSYPLTELGSGRYGAPNYNLDPTKMYRLRIRTLTGTYASDFTETKITPPIDTLAWVAQDDGVHISLNTHNPQNTSRYYRWDYTETWEIYTVYIPDIQPIVHCWGTQSNNEVLLNSTATLSNDIIKDQAITFIPNASEKLSYRYSIIVKQYTLTDDAYLYWTLLKRNTQQLGSIFDSQPSVSIGNLHNVNKPQEPVIGYISAGTATSTRIFIDRFTQLPVQYFSNYYYSQVNYCDPTARVTGLYLLPDCATCNGKPRVPPVFW